MKRIVLKRSVIAVALTLPVSPLVLAQEATEKPIPKVVVTGSNIARIESETSSPVQTIRAQDIKRLGVSSVKELMDTLTSSDRSALSDAGGSNSFAGGASSVSLRALGKQSTLVLLNSRRVAPYPLADYNEVFTNLDTLPLDAVERVEILRNGGSSIYGSDAVAGVINVITRSDYRGLTVSGSFNRSVEQQSIRNGTVSVTGGFGDLDNDRFNVLANVEYFKRNDLFWREVVDDINPTYGEYFGTVAPGSGLMFGNRGTPSTFSFPGNLIGQGALPGCTTKNAGGLCVHDRFSRFQATPAAERVNSLVSARFKVNESMEAFAELLYSHTTTDYSGAFATYGSANPNAVWGDPSTGQGRTFIYRGLPATHPLNTSGEELELRYRFLDDPSYRKSTSDQYRALAGVKGTLTNKWDWEAALGIMGGKTKDRSRGGFFSDSGFKEVIGDYNVDDPNFFNRAYKLGQINSAEVINKLFPENGYDGKITQTFIDLKASGQVGSIGGRPVMAAVGGDVRHEKIRIRPTANLLAGDIVSNGASSADASRTNESLFAEINAPVMEKLELVGAARFDKFPGFDGRVSPKVAARWKATENFLLRATLESGFRAPNLTESAPSSKFAFDNGVVDPKRCDQAQALASDLRDQADALPGSDPNVALLLARADIVEGNECAGGVASIVRNNPDLKPETSRSGTVGFVIEPVKGTSFAMDYFRIERKNEINTKSTSELLSAEDSLMPGIINRLPLAQDKTFTAAERAQYGVTAGPLSSTSGMFENVSKTRTSGVDLALASRFSLPFGRLDVNGNGTYLLDLRNFAPTRNGGSWGDNLAGRYGYSKFTANVLGALTTGAFTNSMRLVYFSPQKLQGDYFDEEYTKEGCAANDWGPGVCRVGSEVRWDYNLSYTGIKNLTLSLNVRNLFDQRPPLDLKSFNRDGGGVIPQNLDDVAGRRIRVTAEYRFQ
ncbi:TonB-dependent receptor [Pseudoduganella sp. DS3]|uniref:TonB-dependent receptor n=1 Tax=Pseudoduganella guangdongensis TaxID=2692179 RepID=A0A6N9HDK2_9BURK|nr:TonB-dependent receptor [Pseudoduganella guangdongensis]